MKPNKLWEILGLVVGVGCAVYADCGHWSPLIFWAVGSLLVFCWRFVALTNQVIEVIEQQGFYQRALDVLKGKES